MWDDGIFRIGFFAAALLVVWRMRLIYEHERYAVIENGKYQGLKGPGVAWKALGSVFQEMRLRVGDVGELRATRLAFFAGIGIPVEVDSSVPLGAAVRIVGFRGRDQEAQVLAILEPGVQREQVCPNCGHSFRQS